MKKPETSSSRSEPLCNDISDQQSTSSRRPTHMARVVPSRPCPPSRRPPETQATCWQMVGSPAGRAARAHRIPTGVGIGESAPPSALQGERGSSKQLKSNALWLSGLIGPTWAGSLFRRVASRASEELSAAVGTHEAHVLRAVLAEGTLVRADVRRGVMGQSTRAFFARALHLEGHGLAPANSRKCMAILGPAASSSCLKKTYASLHPWSPIHFAHFSSWGLR